MTRALLFLLAFIIMTSPLPTFKTEAQNSGEPPLKTPSISRSDMKAKTENMNEVVADSYVQMVELQSFRMIDALYFVDGTYDKVGKPDSETARQALQQLFNEKIGIDEFSQHCLDQYTQARESIKEDVVQKLGEDYIKSLEDAQTRLCSRMDEFYRDVPETFPFFTSSMSPKLQASRNGNVLISVGLVRSIVDTAIEEEFGTVERYRQVREQIGERNIKILNKTKQARKKGVTNAIAIMNVNTKIDAAMRFLMSHEAAHIKLGHYDAPVGNCKEEQDLELEADQEAKAHFLSLFNAIDPSGAIVAQDYSINGPMTGFILAPVEWVFTSKLYEVFVEADRRSSETCELLSASTRYANLLAP